MDYRTGSHTKYKIEYHFVWVTKYRYQVLVGEVAERVRELVDISVIVNSVELLLNDDEEYNNMAKAVNPYGDGKASKNIYNFILDRL